MGPPCVYNLLALSPSPTLPSLLLWSPGLPTHVQLASDAHMAEDECAGSCLPFISTFLSWSPKCLAGNILLVSLIFHQSKFYVTSSFQMRKQMHTGQQYTHRFMAGPKQRLLRAESKPFSLPVMTYRVLTAATVWTQVAANWVSLQPLGPPFWTPMCSGIIHCQIPPAPPVTPTVHMSCQQPPSILHIVGLLQI